VKRYLVILAACGGGAKNAPPPEPPAPVISAKPITRVPVEDSEMPEEGVTVLNSKGHMEQAAVQAGIKPHETELSDCYMSKVGRRRWLGGHVQIHWDIKPDGVLSAVKLSESNLGAWPIEKCLIDVARSATFAKPIGGPADFVLPLDFSEKGGAQVWDEDKSLRAVGGQLVKLDPCAKKAKVPAPDDVIITVYVGPYGKTQSIGFSSAASEIDDKWAECAMKAVTAWRLPDPRGQIAKLAIKYRGK
jgi:hypothetical protein